MKKLSIIIVFIISLLSNPKTVGGELSDDLNELMDAHIEFMEVVAHRQEFEAKLDVWIEFMDAVAHRESSDRYYITKGQYWGRYQIGRLARKDLRLNTSKNKFLRSTELQDYAFIEYLKINKRYLGDYVYNYDGETINGVLVTLSGLLASSHLVGANSIKRMLRNPTFIPFDGNNTTALEYLYEFSNFELDLEIETETIIAYKNGLRASERNLE